MEEDCEQLNAFTEDPVSEVYLQRARQESHFAIYNHTTLEGMSSTTHFES